MKTKFDKIMCCLRESDDNSEQISALQSQIDGIVDGLATVATTGDYDDLVNKPTIPEMPQLAAVATSGDYDDLTNKPEIPVLPQLAAVATSGDYDDLTNKPVIPVVPQLAAVATSGDYDDLTNKPVIPVVPQLAAVATSGDYDDLVNKPTIPAVPENVSAFNNDAGYLTRHQDISGKTDSLPDEPENNLALWDGAGQFKASVSLLRILQDIVDGNTADIQDIIASLTPVPAVGWKRVTAAKTDYSGEYILAGIAYAQSSGGGGGGGESNRAAALVVFRRAFKTPLANYVGSTVEIGTDGDTANETITSGADSATVITVTKKGQVDSGTYSGRPYYSISYLNANNERKYWTYSAQGLSNISSDSGSNAHWIFYQNDNGYLSIINRGSTNVRLYYGEVEEGFVQKNFVTSDPVGYSKPTLFELVTQ